MNKPQHLLRVSELQYRYPKQDGHAIGPLSFEIAAGESVVILGPSGVGKSTILNLIAGFLQPTRSGDGAPSVLIQGQDAASLRPWQRHIGIAFQQGAGLQEHRTIRQNLTFALTQGRQDGGSVETALNNALIHWGILSRATDNQREKILQTPVSELSGGQRQRVALARCFIRTDKQLFLLDEPFEGLDGPLRQSLAFRLRRTIAEARSDQLNQGFLLVTHNQPEALALADRVLFLEQWDPNEPAVILCQSSPEVLYSRPPHLAVASFLGDPVMNLWPSSQLKELIPAAGRLSQRASFDEGTLVGVRPECLHIHTLGAAIPDAEFSVPCRLVELSFEGEEWIGRFTLAETDLAGAFQVPTKPSSLTAGTEFLLTWDLENTHLFDAATGSRLEDLD